MHIEIFGTCNWRICLLALCAACDLCRAEPPIVPDNLFLPPNGFVRKAQFSGITKYEWVIDGDRKWFARIASFVDERGAVRAWRTLREEHFDLPIAVYQLPWERARPYWLVAASYATEQEAMTTALALRALKRGAVAVAPLAEAVPIAPSGTKEALPLPVASTRIDPIGPSFVGPVISTIDAQNDVALVIVSVSSAKKAESVLVDLQTRYPTLQFGVYRSEPQTQAAKSTALSIALTEARKVAPDSLPSISLWGTRIMELSVCNTEVPVPDCSNLRPFTKPKSPAAPQSAAESDGFTYDIAIAAFVSRESVRDALFWARKAGLVETPILRHLADDPLRTSRLIPAHDLTIGTAARVRECFTSKAALTIESMAQCSGMIMTPSALTRCILESRCEGVRVDGSQIRTSQDLVMACLHESRCDSLGIDSSKIAKARDTLQACLAPRTAGSPDETRASRCAPAQEVLKAANIGAEAIECLTNLTCRGVRQGLTEVERRVARFADANGINSVEAQLVPAARFLGALGNAAVLKPRIEVCAALGREARESDDAAKEAAARKCYADIALSGADEAQRRCVAEAASSSGVVSCLIDTMTGSAPSVQEARAKAKCLQASGGNVAQVAQCLGGNTSIQELSDFQACVNAARSQREVVNACAAKLLPVGNRARVACLADPEKSEVEKTVCASGASGDVAKVASCIDKAGSAEVALRSCASAALPGDPAKVAACLAASRRHAAELALCLTGNEDVKKAVEAARCLRAANDTFARASCLGLNVDPQTSETLNCVAASGGDRGRLAACALPSIVPPEYREFASCAIHSQSGAGVILCAAAPQMNEESRIATECAMTTGGVPIAFAACTAGRLTVRELEKCLTGTFGKDCFGPNNTIVVAFRTIANDLQHGLGGNNDLVRLARDVGREIENGLRGIGNFLASAFNEVGRFFDNLIRGFQHFLDCLFGCKG